MGGADAVDSVRVRAASRIVRRSTNMNPSESPLSAALAALKSSLAASSLEPFVSMAAFTDSRSPTMATLPSTRASAAWAAATSTSVNTVSSVPS
jgi:hypothetical protein